MSIAVRTPMMIKQFFIRFTIMLVKVIEIALVSLVTLVTRVPTGILFS